MNMIIAKIHHWNDAGFIEFSLWAYVFHQTVSTLYKVVEYFISNYGWRSKIVDMQTPHDKFMKIRKY